jgi:SAM-dependent methyltransferase
MTMGGQEQDRYVGTELELFQEATNWKRYWTGRLKPYIFGHVVEVGAGIGANTGYLAASGKSWISVEPDARLADKISARIRAGELPPTCKVFVGRLANLPHEQHADTIIYADTLEHIEDDVAEVDEAVRRLRKGGHLIVIGPAHRWLMSPFDHAVGHYRRYEPADMKRLTLWGLRLVTQFQLDSVGAAASLANRIMLSRSVPSRAQILFWDRVMVPISRAIDPLIAYRFGKSIVGVWQRT